MASKEWTYRGVVFDQYGTEDGPWSVDGWNPEESAWRQGVDAALAVHAPGVPLPQESACPEEVPWPHEHDAHLWAADAEALRCPGKPMAPEAAL
jgi:hypothetical protein